ncbi:TIGR02594 family protein [Agrobacterium rhizogenes]|uniref:NlpC/P60 family protein n=1 Tax=Rhizobium rhizogenes TaxID=359 RepID=UPI001574888B|nr:TIGR02594 family protein [Rhizobium rhizogenes]NTG86221.1 TIGR02594 family protein [Rhizobium rhizogenes]
MNTTVQSVQRRLTALGYNLGPSGADGVLGRMTIGAITKFQADKKLAIQFPGTIGPTTLAALGITARAATLPPWVVLAQTKAGLNEVRDNKELSTFLRSDGSTVGDPARVPWCGDFVETCIAVTLPREPVITNPYWALNWLKFGLVIPEDQPVMGAIGVATRDGGGHVFFVIGHDQNYFHILGGNQSNSVSIEKMDKGRVVGLRYPSTYPKPDNAMPFSVFTGKISTNES